MNFINNSTGQIVSLYELRLLHPNTSFNEVTPDLKTLFGVSSLTYAPMPAYTPYQEAVQKQPELVSGEWVVGWEVVDMTASQLVTKFDAEKAEVLRKLPADVDAILLSKIGQRLGEYSRAEVDARAYLAAHALDANAPVPRKVSGQVTAANLSPVTAANAIVTQAVQLIEVEDTMRDVRLLRQAQTRAIVLSETPTRQEVITAIESVVAIASTWDAFISALKAQLGV